MTLEFDSCIYAVVFFYGKYIHTEGRIVSNEIEESIGTKKIQEEWINVCYHDSNI